MRAIFGQASPFRAAIGRKRITVLFPVMGTLAFSAAAQAGLLPSAELVGGTSGNVTVPVGSESSNGQPYPTGGIDLLSSPGTYNYGNSFSTDSSDITGIPNLPPGVSYNFYDDLFIEIPTATVDTLDSSVDLNGVLGITNLDARLYSLSSNPGGLVLGAPSGGVIEAWGNSVTFSNGVSQSTELLGSVNLSSGDYVLEIRGQTDSQGGSYSGVINLSPVPLPGSLPLALPGVAALAALAVCRRRSFG